MITWWLLLVIFGTMCIIPLYGGKPATIVYSFPPTIDSNQKNVALTFDDGPHAILTPLLLDRLNNTNAKVTFFVMGVKVVLHPDIVRRALKEGHEVANHVWDHPVLTKIPWQVARDQILRTSEAVFNVSGYTPKTMRPPYGNTNRGLNNRIYSETKLPVIMWSLDTLDWMRPNPKEIVKKILQKVKPGTVILCHDIHPGTIEAIPEIVQQLHEQGYSFKTVSEMIAIHYPQ
jgi:peptidoglycan/xylan/chitin deacetylase (PgdA/CDA1 family)